MILFCDTSALVKLYVEEDGSEAVAARAQASACVAVCRITWVEAIAAFARRTREQPTAAATLALARQRMREDWPHFLCIDITQALVEQAGDCADAFSLRADDSVQLAALRLLHSEQPGEVRFACFDDRLNAAARVLGIATG